MAPGIIQTTPYEFMFECSIHATNHAHFDFQQTARREMALYEK